MMNKLFGLVTFAVCTFLAVESFAFSAEEAHRLYDEHYRNTSPSVQECGEYLFVIVEGALPGGSREDASKAILSAQMSALEKYVGTGVFGFVSPFGDKLTGRLSVTGGFEITDCPVVTVEENIGKNHYREVSVFALAPVKAERTRMLQRKPSRRSVGAWSRDLAKLLDKCPSEEMRTRIMIESGLFIPLLFGPEHFVRCIDIPVCGEEIEKLFSEWVVKPKSYEDCISALDVLPTFSPAHRRLVELCLIKGDRISAVNEWIKSGIAGKTDETVFKSMLEKLSADSGTPVWREFGELRSECLNISLLRIENNKTDAISKCMQKALGRVAFYDNKDAEATRIVEDAKMMFREGRNLPLIIQKLETSIDRNPGLVGAWHLYGDALRADKRWRSAILAYHQALSNNVKDSEVIYGLARCYELMGLKNLAAAAIWWGLVSMKDDVWFSRFESLLKRVYPDVFL